MPMTSRLRDAIVGSFTEQELTFHRDRFVALAGIAQRMQMHLNSRYLLGLWESHFLQTLAWEVLEQYPEVLSSVDTETLPSWSFIAVEASANPKLSSALGTPERWKRRVLRPLLLT